MINLKQLEIMYQQWMQDNTSYIYRWFDFVELVAKETNVAQDVIVRELEKTYWFKKSND